MDITKKKRGYIRKKKKLIDVKVENSLKQWKGTTTGASKKFLNITCNEWVYGKSWKGKFLVMPPTEKQKVIFSLAWNFLSTKKSNFRDDGRENDKALSVHKEEREKKFVCLGRFANRHTESDERERVECGKN